MSRQPVGYCDPEKSPFGAWYVKMDTLHNPSYYLVNRTSVEHPRVALQKDLDNVGQIYFANEHQAQVAIISYIEFWQGRGVTLTGTIPPVETVVNESQVMEFV